jgi:lipopolysaccharide transport system ATP-binding protein
MSDAAIRVENLGKMYYIGAVREQRYRTMRDALARGVTAPFRRTGALLRGQATGAAELDEQIWALRNISFEVPVGQVLGIIGHNGAGKSTLLKILSRITEPTEGFVEIRGRVGSLLEVGTGFHPELTGRENVYLNGAILGMTRVEIDRKFDEIVDFSGVEQFIDTPVKHYSTGMALRLAFAVAAHLEPEILIVDEVLAVGDAAFQRKCLGLMGKVAQTGRTVLLVSHNMSAVTQLCHRAILLSHGGAVQEGEPNEVVAAYLSSGDAATGSWLRPPEDETPGEEVQMKQVRVLTGSGRPTAIVAYDEDFKIELSYTIRQEIRDLAVLYGLVNARGEIVWASWDTDSTDLDGAVRIPGCYTSTCSVPGRTLKPGRYFLNVVGHIPNVKMLDLQLRVLAFDVSPTGYEFRSGRDGAVTPLLQWTVSRVEA